MPLQLNPPPPSQVADSALIGDNGVAALFRNNSINNPSFLMSLRGAEKWDGGGDAGQESSKLGSRSGRASFVNIRWQLGKKIFVFCQPKGLTKRL